MLRSAFLKRIALFAAACVFVDVAGPKERGETVGKVKKSYRFHAYALPVAAVAKRRQRTGA